MAKISYEEILALQRKINIVEIVKDYVPLVQKGRNYFGVCPFHDDHNPSMSVSNERQMYKCFVCGAAGNVFNFVMDYEKISYYEAVKKVAEKIGISVDIGKIERKQENNPYFEIYNLSLKYYQNTLNTPSGKIARNYLKNRNINEDVIKYFQIGLSPNDDSLTKLLKNKKISSLDLIKSGIGIKREGKIYDIYKNRIMFPLFDLNGNAVAFSGRIYDDSDTSKYINTMETDIFKKGKLLYNYHNAKDIARKEKEIIVVEGFMDVIRLYTIGIFNVVATMGTAITSTQASLIRKLSPNIILMFDGDKAGEKATLNAIEELKNTDSIIKVIRLEENLDPDEYILKKGKEKMLLQLKHASSLFNYKAEVYKRDLNFNDANDVSKYINLIKNEIEKTEDEIIRDLQIKKISDLTGVSIETIKSKLDIKLKNVKIINHKKDLKQSKYEKASRFILFHLIKNTELIEYYYNNLSYLPNNIDRVLANEIVLFYKKFKSFNLNDFIIYLTDKKDLIDRVVFINDLDYKIDYTKEEVDSYFDSIKRFINEQEILKLTNELKKETNAVLRKEIAKKIVDMKIKEKK